MSAPRYRIKTVEDFISVPLDKRAVCLKDFAFWLSIADQKKELDKALVELTGIPEDSKPLITSSFVWVDDGIEGVSSIEIVTKETA